MLFYRKILFGCFLVSLLAGAPLIGQAATIAELQAKVASLLAEIAQLTSVKAKNSSATISGGLKLKSSLHLGSTDGKTAGQVSLLQQFLKEQGLYTGPVGGTVGPNTEKAIKEFQKRNGIVYFGNYLTTGYGATGPKTRAKILEVSRLNKNVSLESSPAASVSAGGGGGSGGGSGRTTTLQDQPASLSGVPVATSYSGPPTQISEIDSAPISNTTPPESSQVEVGQTINNLTAAISISAGASWKNLSKSTYFPTSATTQKTTGVSYTTNYRGYAPLPVFFEAWQSSPKEKIAEYEWTFNDPNSYGQNPNIFRGMNSAHVFEKPGTYNVTLRVRDQAGNYSAPVTERVVVLPRDGAEYWVDAVSGSDQNSGSKNAPWKTFDRVLDYVAANRFSPGDTVYFKRGQIFSVTKSIGAQGQLKNVLFTAEPGSGTKPLIQFSGQGIVPHFLRRTGAGLGYVAFTDLDFSFVSPNGSPFVNQTGGGEGEGLIGLYGDNARAQNILLLRVKAYNPKQSVLLFSTAVPYASDIFIVDSFIGDLSIKDYGDTRIFGSMSRLAVLNSDFDLSGNHVFYLQSVDKAVFSGNHFSRVAFGRTALRITGFNPPYPANNILVANNIFDGWIDPRTNNDDHNNGREVFNGGGNSFNYLLVEFAANAPDKDKLINNLVFERNIIRNAQQCLSLADIQGGIIRNNLFINCDQALSIGMFRQWDRFPSRDIVINNNSFLSAKGTPFKIYSFAGSATYPATQYQHQNISLFNNLFYQEKFGSTDRWLFIPDRPLILNTFKSDNNIFYSPVSVRPFLIGSRPVLDWAAWQKMGFDLSGTTTNPKLAGGFPRLGGYSSGHPTLTEGASEISSLISGLRPSAGSPAIDGGRNIGTAFGLNDYSGQNRIQSRQVDIGALESSFSRAEISQPAMNQDGNLSVATTSSSGNAATTNNNQTTGGTTGNTASVPTTVDLSAGLVVYYSFDNFSGQGVGDTVSGKIASCGSVCPSSLGGMVGQALSFNGTSTYLKIDNDTSLNPVKNFSISLWLKADNWSGGNRRIIQKGATDNQYRLTEQSGSLLFELKGVSSVTAPLPSTGSWHHLVAVYDGVNIKIYQDGVLVNKRGASGNPLVSGDPLYIGTKTSASPAGDYFSGQLDEIRLYNRALTENEIRTLAGKPILGGFISNQAAATRDVLLKIIKEIKDFFAQ